MQVYDILDNPIKMGLSEKFLDWVFLHHDQSSTGRMTREATAPLSLRVYLLDVICDFERCEELYHVARLVAERLIRDGSLRPKFGIREDGYYPYLSFSRTPGKMIMTRSSDDIVYSDDYVSRWRKVIIDQADNPAIKLRPQRDIKAKKPLGRTPSKYLNLGPLPHLSPKKTQEDTANLLSQEYVELDGLPSTPDRQKDLAPKLKIETDPDPRPIKDETLHLNERYPLFTDKMAADIIKDHFKNPRSQYGQYPTNKYAHNRRETTQYYYNSRTVQNPLPYILQFVTWEHGRIECLFSCQSRLFLIQNNDVIFISDWERTPPKPAKNNKNKGHPPIYPS